ncbi:MAG TPA: 2-oxoacid:acceptor oxidoreductase family protein [Candidatus Cloacimonadota bacterium]|nr:2-oxoacid:acceptor oxidoreductase family protein [Candidatus Cloacimonadota bacterium]HPS38239.1 2-oxoacid:acceptor oxidoreductase family protein [Candidatus Cloacimonadota bacterium]
MTDRPYTVLVGGKAGDGVKKVVQVMAAVFHKRGWHTFQMDDYQSLIKGGHNFSIVSASPEKICNNRHKADLIICFDKKSYDLHREELNPGGCLFYDKHDGDLSGTGIELTRMMKDSYAVPSNVSIGALAIFFAHLGLSEDDLLETIRLSYKRNLEENLSYARKVFPLVTPGESIVDLKTTPLNSILLSGNQAIALGAWAAGLDMYFGYPMTPASSILHYYAAQSQKLGVKAVHAESELAAVNMAIGAIVGGARAAVGSSGGGLALMQEAFSMAGIVEAPLLCFLSSRPGPATGVSTYTAQEDLMFALHQGHGEFSRIVATPDSYERAFSLSAELLCLAWEFQIPAILLTEKHLSECITDLALPLDQIREAVPSLGKDTQDYDRYALTPDGVSPMLFPPSDATIKWNSHEHLPSGLRTDKAADIITMKDKRALKQPGIEEATKRHIRVNTYGSGDKLIFSYGSTTLELREALKLLPPEYKLVSLVYLEPFPSDELAQYRGREAVIVEHSRELPFAAFLREKADIVCLSGISKYDGRSFDPDDLANRIEEAFHD